MQIWFSFYLIVLITSEFKYLKLNFCVVLKKHMTWPKSVPHTAHQTCYIMWYVTNHSIYQMTYQLYTTLCTCI